MRRRNRKPPGRRTVKLLRKKAERTYTWVRAHKQKMRDGRTHLIEGYYRRK